MDGVKLPRESHTREDSSVRDVSLPATLGR